MIQRIAISSVISWGVAVAAGFAMAEASDRPKLIYEQQCAGCHGRDRLGGTGPALIPETLSRMNGPSIAKVIANGRSATQMPGFAATLSGDDIAMLTE